MSSNPVGVALEGELTVSTIDRFKEMLWSALAAATGEAAPQPPAHLITPEGFEKTPARPQLLSSSLDVNATETAQTPPATRKPLATPRLILDLQGVSMVTTPGIGLLLEFNREVQKRGGKVVFMRPAPTIDGVIRRTQLDRVLLLARTQSQAEALLAR